VSSLENSGKHGKAPRCPQCGHTMELSDSPVMLVGQDAQAEPPVWLCRQCWVVLPVEREHLHIVPSAT
jgi:hypothetical protein